MFDLQWFDAAHETFRWYCLGQLETPKSILFVCMVNMTRSPLAAAIMRRKLENCAIRDVILDSAGVGVTTEGLPPNAKSVALARQHGIEMDAKHKSRRLSEKDCQTFDLIFAVDQGVLSRIRAMFPYAIRPEQLHLLTSPTPNLRTSDLSTPVLLEEYVSIYESINAACDAILQKYWPHMLEQR